MPRLYRQGQQGRQLRPCDSVWTCSHGKQACQSQCAPSNHNTWSVLALLNASILFIPSQSRPPIPIYATPPRIAIIPGVKILKKPSSITGSAPLPSLLLFLIVRKERQLLRPGRSLLHRSCGSLKHRSAESERLPQSKVKHP